MRILVPSLDRMSSLNSPQHLPGAQYVQCHSIVILLCSESHLRLSASLYSQLATGHCLLSAGELRMPAEKTQRLLRGNPLNTPGGPGLQHIHAFQKARSNKNESCLFYESIRQSTLPFGGYRACFVCILAADTAEVTLHVPGENARVCQSLQGCSINGQDPAVWLGSCEVMARAARRLYSKTLELRAANKPHDRVDQKAVAYAVCDRVRDRVGDFALILRRLDEAG